MDQGPAHPYNAGFGARSGFDEPGRRCLLHQARAKRRGVPVGSHEGARSILPRTACEAGFLGHWCQRRINYATYHLLRGREGGREGANNVETRAHERARRHVFDKRSLGEAGRGRGGRGEIDQAGSGFAHGSLLEVNKHILQRGVNKKRTGGMGTSAAILRGEIVLCGEYRGNTCVSGPWWCLLTMI